MQRFAKKAGQMSDQAITKLTWKILFFISLLTEDMRCHQIQTQTRERITSAMYV